MRTATVSLLTALGAAILAVAPVAARDPVTPDQRIGRLEKQVRQIQKQVFPKGQPADTAGVDDTPAATQDSVNSLNSRLDALEKQMADLVRTSEENGNRLSQMEADLAKVRADYDQRVRALENAAAAAAPVGPTPSNDGTGSTPVETRPNRDTSPPPPSRPKLESGKGKGKTSTSIATGGSDLSKPDEAAYDKGFKLWQAGKYDDAYAALTKMAKDYPDSHRASWAYNLAGRAQYDDGKYRAAAETLLANYRRDPQGERAQDSLYYLGKSLVKLGQPSQACKAYGELEGVYGSGVRADLKKLLTTAKAEAKCN